MQPTTGSEFANVLLVLFLLILFFAPFAYYLSIDDKSDRNG